MRIDGLDRRDLTRLNHALAFGSELAEWTEGAMRRV